MGTSSVDSSTSPAGIRLSIDNGLFSQQWSCPLYSIEVENPVSTAQKIGQNSDYWEQVRNVCVPVIKGRGQQSIFLKVNCKAVWMVSVCSFVVLHSSPVSSLDRELTSNSVCLSVYLVKNASMVELLTAVNPMTYWFWPPKHVHSEHFEHLRKSQWFRRYSNVGSNIFNEKGVVIFGVFTADRDFGTHSKLLLVVICVALLQKWLAIHRNNQDLLTGCCGGGVSCCGSCICCYSRDCCWINDCCWSYQAQCSRIREGLSYLSVGEYLPMLLHCPPSWLFVMYLLDYEPLN